jgi:hypothetical protein
MSEIRLKPEIERLMEEGFDLKREGMQLLGLIAAEFKSDPMSVQCFDLRVVERVKYVTERLEQIQRKTPGWLL